MKRTWIVLVVVLLGSLPARPEEAIAEFRRIEKERAEALRLGDVEAVDRIYADDFIGISRTGRVVRKPELLRVVRERGVNDVTFSMVELEVRFVNELAFVLFRHRGTDAAGKFVREGRVLHVYAKRDGAWKVVSAQATPIAP